MILGTCTKKILVLGLTFAISVMASVFQQLQGEGSIASIPTLT
jgi:hypothetical protein